MLGSCQEMGSSNPQIKSIHCQLFAGTDLGSLPCVAKKLELSSRSSSTTSGKRPSETKYPLTTFHREMGSHLDRNQYQRHPYNFLDLQVCLFGHCFCMMMMMMMPPLRRNPLQVREVRRAGSEITILVEPGGSHSFLMKVNMQ